MDASTMLAKTKARLIEAAKKEYGEIVPRGENPFRQEDDVLSFQFKTQDNSTLYFSIHTTHTRLIHKNIESEK